jgi:predicted DNA-binding WGR domain protein
MTEAKTTGRYENTETHRFWSAKIIGTFVTISFGNIGTSGHRASREFGTPKAAERFVIEQVKSKIAEGFKKADEM